MAYVSTSNINHDGEVVVHAGDKVTKAQLEKLGMDFDEEVRRGLVVTDEEAKELAERGDEEVVDGMEPAGYKRAEEK